MLIGETVRVAFQSIRSNKLRAMLTMLGVIIGVAAVITVVAMGSGAQKAVQDRINALGANLVTINPGQGMQMGAARSDGAPMYLKDAEALKRDATTLTAVVPEMGKNQQVIFGNKNINTSIVGTTSNYAAARNYTITAGRMFTDGDDAAQQRYAVIGSDVPKMLDANGPAIIGQTFTIRGIPFEIIGILSAKGAQGFQNPDEQILIPINTARYRVFGSDRLRSISVIVNEKVPMEVGMVDVERIMRREHKIRPGGNNNFAIRSPKEFLATSAENAQTFSTLLLSIAAVSLIVGGIGIMNIMLVSVTERTKEIGIRKALGATRITILSQFLIEALVLCISGGAVGILLGIGASMFVSKQYGSNTVISPTAVIVAFLFSAAVGLFFGLWPARRAASLDPIQALRYE
jgi:putative ABC transport system permease protein